MSKRTWICVRCRKTYLRKKSFVSVECPNCHNPCVDGDRVYGRIPSPKQIKEWDRFWADYEATKAATEEAERKRRESTPPEPAKDEREPKNHVAYVEGICAPLIETLIHSASLPVNQLAGHASNVDFWVSEAIHCLAVIDGYQKRFVRLRGGQEEFEKKHSFAKSAPPLQRGAKHRKRQELRQEVCAAIERFLARCHREGLLAQTDLKTRLASVGIVG
jgi:hypothetical protein